ncbi:phosphatase PAP2 family protein [Acinetobacter sp. YH12239]|uniref:phosphatase PAP2 family protein n=1 Tax=Acinetobacter sp. YH12239 TaxID=2601166 RepID=UPI0015D38C90|nr:phosphatase PAP2 family protein [Acinetobacter sp. YH12239]
MPYLLILIGCLGITISSIGIYIPTIQQLDLTAVSWMSQHRNPLIDGIAVLLSHIGGLPIMLMCVAIWTLQQWRLKQYANCLFISLGLVGGACLGWLLKYAFDRPRPNAIYQIVETYGAAFPSAHSLYAAVIAGLMIIIFRNHHQSRIIFVAACIWFVGMGFSRVYLGAHYPTDVVAGWSIALIWLTILWLVLSQRIAKQTIIFREKSNEVE